jgi:hypothetical protein
MVALGMLRHQLFERDGCAPAHTYAPGGEVVNSGALESKSTVRAETIDEREKFVLQVRRPHAEIYAGHALECGA